MAKRTINSINVLVNNQEFKVGVDGVHRISLCEEFASRSIFTIEYENEEKEISVAEYMIHYQKPSSNNTPTNNSGNPMSGTSGATQVHQSAKQSNNSPQKQGVTPVSQPAKAQQATNNPPLKEGKPLQNNGATRYEGIVKWWNHDKGIGFLTFENSKGEKEDVFLHFLNLIDDNSIELKEGEPVTFSVDEDKPVTLSIAESGKGLKAIDVVVHSSGYLIR